MKGDVSRRKGTGLGAQRDVGRTVCGIAGALQSVIEKEMKNVTGLCASSTKPEDI